jgi:ketosteroid isomerase-like protein
MDDVEEIKKLKARYFRALDSKDWDLYGSVFADDVVVDLRNAGGGLYQGRDEFLAYARALTIVQSVHQGHMPEIELTGPNSASGVWALEDYNIWEDGSQNHGWGHYLETYEKSGERWHIKTMRLSYLRVERSFGTAPMIAGASKVAHLHGLNPASG